jgi:hypothetical protein
MNFKTTFAFRSKQLKRKCYLRHSYTQKIQENTSTQTKQKDTLDSKSNSSKQTKQAKLKKKVDDVWELI